MTTVAAPVPAPAEAPFTPAPFRGPLKVGQPIDGLIVLAGEEKSGKTALMASFPDSYILEMDKGGGDRLSGRFHDVESLKEFRPAFKWAMTDPSIKTVGIDTITSLCDMYEAEVANSHGVSSFSEKKQGVDSYLMWDQYNDKIANLIAYIKASKKLVIMTSHLRPAQVNQDGVITAPQGLDLYPKAARIVGTKADVIGMCYKRQLSAGAEYFCTFKGGVAGRLGSRVEELNDKEIKLPKENPYSAFEAVFKTK